MLYQNKSQSLTITLYHPNQKQFLSTKVIQTTSSPRVYLLWSMIHHHTCWNYANMCCLFQPNTRTTITTAPDVNQSHPFTSLSVPCLFVRPFASKPPAAITAHFYFPSHSFPINFRLNIHLSCVILFDSHRYFFSSTWYILPHQATRLIHPII